MDLKEVREKMLAKARTSCLTPADVKLLKFEPYEENHELDPETLFPRFAGFKIPYFKLDGSVDPDFYRFRLLQAQPSKGFAAITEEPKKPRRYTQPTGTQCGVYLPPMFDLSWATLAKDPATELLITEGELKAACACKIGVATIGLGGVYNWRSSKNNQELLPILEKFNWEGRKVTICFDSDAMSNPMVRMAASRLAYILAMRKALVQFAHLPEGEEAEDGTHAKQGLDDFIYSFVVAATAALGAARGAKKLSAKDIEKREEAAIAEGAEEFGRILMEAEELGPGQELHHLNDEVAVIRSTGEVIELYTGNVYSQSVFSDTVYRNRKYNEKSEENGRMVTKYAAKEWVGWKYRNDVIALAYEPSCNNMLTEYGEFNTWYAQRWPLNPKKGSIAPWEKLFKQVFGTLSLEHQTWVRQWLAYPIQKPGTKLFTAMLVWGLQGSGKTLIGELMDNIYGKNFGTVTHDQLSSQFTEWAHDKQFILGDEIAIGDKRGLANKLKDMVSRRTLTINIKNRKTYRVRDCINYYFTSNSESALYIENSDRRYFIHSVSQQTLAKDEYIAIRKWWDEGGAARVMHYMQNEVSLDGFEPTAHAPITNAKLEMTVAGRSEIEDWAHDLVREPDSILRGDKTYDLFRTEDLLDVWEAKESRKGRAGNKALSAALSAAGAFRIANGQNGAIINGARSRLWALRNVDQYRKMGAAQAGKLYEAERPPQRAVGSGQKFAQSRTN